MSQCETSCLTIQELVETTLKKWIENGLIAPGLVSCEGDNHLVQDDRVVLCGQLAKKVQEAINSGAIEIPNLSTLELNETELTVRMTDGTFATVDLKPLIDRIPKIAEVLINEDGTIAILLTDGNRITSSTTLKTLIYGTLKMCSGGVNIAETSFVDCDYLTDKLSTLEDELQTYTMEAIRNAFLEMYSKTLTDNVTILGNGTTGSPIRVNEEWLLGWINEYMGDLGMNNGAYGQVLSKDKNGRNKWVSIHDCHGEPINIVITPMATCANLDERVPPVVVSDQGKVFVVRPDGTTGWVSLQSCQGSIDANNTKLLTCAEFDILVPKGGLAGQVLTRADDGTFIWAYSKIVSADGVKGSGTPSDPVRADEQWLNDRYVRNNILPISRVGDLTTNRLPINGSYFSVIYPYNEQSFPVMGYLEPNGDINFVTPVTNGEAYRATYSTAERIDGEYANSLTQTDDVYKLVGLPNDVYVTGLFPGTESATLANLRSEGDSNYRGLAYVDLNGTSDYSAHNYIILSSELAPGLMQDQTLNYLGPVAFKWRGGRYIAVPNATGNDIRIVEVADNGSLTELRGWAGTNLFGTPFSNRDSVNVIGSNATLNPNGKDSLLVYLDPRVQANSPNSQIGQDQLRLMVAVTKNGIKVAASKWLRTTYYNPYTNTTYGLVHNLTALMELNITSRTAKSLREPAYPIRINALDNGGLVETPSNLIKDNITPRGGYAYNVRGTPLGDGTLLVLGMSTAIGQAHINRGIRRTNAVSAEDVIDKYETLSFVSSRDYGAQLLLPPTISYPGVYARVVDQSLLIGNNSTNNLDNYRARKYNTVDQGILDGANLTNDRLPLSGETIWTTQSKGVAGPIHTGVMMFINTGDEGYSVMDKYGTKSEPVKLLADLSALARDTARGLQGEFLTITSYRMLLDPVPVSDRGSRLGILAVSTLTAGTAKLFYQVVEANPTGDIISLARRGEAHIGFDAGGMTYTSLGWINGADGMSHLSIGKKDWFLVKMGFTYGNGIDGSGHGQIMLNVEWGIDGVPIITKRTPLTDVTEPVASTIIILDGTPSIGIVGPISGATALYAFILYDRGSNQLDGNNRIVLGSARPAEAFTIIVSSPIAIFIAGRQYEVSAQLVDLYALYGEGAKNKTYYLYVRLRNGRAELVVTETPVAESLYNIYIGFARTDDISIAQLETDPVSRIDTYRPSPLPIGSAISVSSGRPDQDRNLIWDTDNPVNI